VQTEILTCRDDLVIRRLILEPGDAMPWHIDACDRFTVVVHGEALRIEFRDGGESATVRVYAGQADWDGPEERVHRAINAGSGPYEEIALFFRKSADVEPQPAGDSRP
jgi:hypothetical protein